MRIAEVVALVDALGLPSWMNLTRTPHVFRHDAQLQAAHRRTGAAYAAVKAAAAEFLRAQGEVAVAAHEAREAGVAVNQLWTSWLGSPAERAVIEARVEFDQEDTHREQISQTVDTIMAALRASGYEPTLSVDDIQTLDRHHQPEPGPGERGPFLGSLAPDAAMMMPTGTSTPADLDRRSGPGSRGCPTLKLTPSSRSSSPDPRP